MSKNIGIPNSASRDRCLLRHAPVVCPPRARCLLAARPSKYEGRPAAEPQGHHQSLAEARRTGSSIIQCEDMEAVRKVWER